MIIYAGIVSALAALAWGVIALFQTPRFLEILNFGSETQRALGEGYAVYVGAFGGVGLMALLVNTPSGYAAMAGFWLGIGLTRLSYLLLNGGWDGLAIGSVAFELTAGTLALAPWIWERYLS
jgi:hypothetical protein